MRQWNCCRRSGFFSTPILFAYCRFYIRNPCCFFFFCRYFKFVRLIVCEITMTIRCAFYLSVAIKEIPFKLFRSYSFSSLIAFVRSFVIKRLAIVHRMSFFKRSINIVSSINFIHFYCLRNFSFSIANVQHIWIYIVRYQLPLVNNKWKIGIKRFKRTQPILTFSYRTHYTRFKRQMHTALRLNWFDRFQCECIN